MLMIISMAYSNHFYNSFHFDDFHVLVNNAYIQDLHNFKLFFTDSSTISSLPANQTYRPMLTLSLAVDYWMGDELTPLWFHSSTFVWYLALCVLLYFFFTKITQAAISSRWNMMFSWFAVAWYGLHTANAETINYISARSDSVSTFWLICSFIVFIYWPKHRRWGLYLVPLIIGLLFKQTLLVFPGLLFLYVLYFEKRAGLLAFKSCLGAFKTVLPALVTCMMMCVFLIKMQSISADTGGGSAYAYLITQPYVMLHYFVTFFLPLQLSADTDLARLTSMADPRFFMGIAFIFMMMIVAFFTSNYTKTRPISFGVFWFFIALIPTSVVPLAEVMNDHRTFFPFIGLLLAVTFALYLVALTFASQFKHKCGLVFVCILVVLGAHGYGTYQRNKVWRTEASLWKDVSIKSPYNGRGLMNYGLTLMGEGRYDEAEKYFLRSLKLNPYYGVLHTNLGILKQAKGKTKEAETYFKQAMQYGPNDPGVLYFYATFLKSTGRIVEAKSLLQRLVRLSPGHQGGRDLLLEINQAHTAENYLDRSLSYYNNKQYEACIKACQQALRLKPNYAAAYNNMCSAYGQLGKYHEAEIACLEALKIDPTFQLAKNNLMDVRHQRSLL
ncbi:MAG: tetratricopeptide repeat protein [Legionellaceae bacterium]|nr:tetratricopeptide repeat protein [Legionellaceae bacterium]